MRVTATGDEGGGAIRPSGGRVSIGRDSDGLTATGGGLSRVEGGVVGGVAGGVVGRVAVGAGTIGGVARGGVASVGGAGGAVLAEGSTGGAVVTVGAIGVVGGGMADEGGGIVGLFAGGIAGTLAGGVVGLLSGGGALRSVRGGSGFFSSFVVPVDLPASSRFSSLGGQAGLPSRPLGHSAFVSPPGGCVEASASAQAATSGSNEQKSATPGLFTCLRAKPTRPDLYAGATWRRLAPHWPCRYATNTRPTRRGQRRFLL
jgi:hypothetical protein